MTDKDALVERLKDIAMPRGTVNPALTPAQRRSLVQAADEIERLREALKPFAFDGLEWKHGDTVTTSMAIRDIYCARAALNGDQP